MRKGLSRPQHRMLAELAEPNKNPRNIWYFPQRNLRTLRVLATKGFARSEEVYHERFANRYGFSITDRGREELRRLGNP